MKHWLIGDVQGCFSTLTALLEAVEFDHSNDRISFAGDLINRGENDRGVMEWVLAHRHCVDTVLGNHDLHFLAQKFCHRPPSGKETYADIFASELADNFAQWLLTQPLAKRLDQNTILCHAGIPHIWSIDDCLKYSAELERTITGSRRTNFFRHMYGNQPNHWDVKHTGVGRLRAITNYLTRMRYITQTGVLEFKCADLVGPSDKQFKPWFSFPRQDQAKVFFGHWAALEGQTNQEFAVALDGGCVWDGKMIAHEWRTGERISINRV